MELLISLLSLWIKKYLDNTDGFRWAEKITGFWSPWNVSTKQVTVFTEIFSGPTKVLGALRLQLSKRRCDKMPFLAERTTYTFWYYQTSRTWHDIEMFLQIWFTLTANLISTPVNRTNVPCYTSGRNSYQQQRVASRNVAQCWNISQKTTHIGRGINQRLKYLQSHLKRNRKNGIKLIEINPS